MPAAGKAGEWNSFEIALSGGAESKINVEIRGPGEPEVNVNYNTTESAAVHYRLVKPGDYFITIFFNNEPINGSPFKTVISPPEESRWHYYILLLPTYMYDHIM